MPVMRGAMKKNVFLSALMCLFCCTPVVAVEEEPRALFIQANAEYQARRYDEAIAVYEGILKSGHESGALYYNLGNAYFKQKELGRAILNYERALDFIPRDPDLRANYHFARSMVRRTDGQDLEKFFFARIAREASLLVSGKEYAWLGVWILGIFAGVHVLSLFLQWRGRINQILAWIGVVTLTGYCLLVVAHYRFFDRRAILLKDAAALFEPRDGATAHFQAREGNSVKLLKIQDGWIKIVRFDGKEGWTVSDYVERVNSRHKISIQK